MAASSLSLFISYARTDSRFVDRLEADLKARSFYTWVDRRKLEGGQVWMDQLEAAIQGCQLLLVVLTPQAVASKYVRMEYRYAQSLGKAVIPLEYQACPQVPIDLSSLQWINFKSSYDEGLASLLIALHPLQPRTLTSPLPLHIISPSPSEMKEPELRAEPALVSPQPAPAPPDPSLTDLYRAGIFAKAQGDLERTAILWQQILDRDPQFQQGTLPRDAQRDNLKQRSKKKTSNEVTL